MKRSSILTIIATLIFCSTFLLDYICKENKLIYRHWLSLSITYYRYAFIITLFIILPCYLIIKKRNIWLKLLGFPIIAYIAFMLLITMILNPALNTNSYYTEIDGQRVIALQKHVLHTDGPIYYVPVNIFFMEKSPDFVYPY
ncbi:hypothetical protein UT300007_00990 [Clostridium sp. CTA-7]